MAIELSEAFVELASRDDPPTLVDVELLARLERAGVTLLEPAIRQLADGRVEVATETDDLERVAAILVGGAGLLYFEALGDEGDRVSAALSRVVYFVERFDPLRRFRLAAIDMRLAEGAAQALLDRDGPSRLFERVLETGLVVTYARPYLQSNRSRLGKGWRPESRDDRRFHDYVIDTLRKPYHAHADRTPHRTLIDTTAMLGLEGPPTFAEAWKWLTDSDLRRLADLAGRQAERLEAEADRLGAELGEEREEPLSVADEFKRLRATLRLPGAEYDSDSPSS